jgi:hypothetical protein
MIVAIMTRIINFIPGLFFFIFSIFCLIWVTKLVHSTKKDAEYLGKVILGCVIAIVCAILSGAFFIAASIPM